MGMPQHAVLAAAIPGHLSFTSSGAGGGLFRGLLPSFNRLDARRAELELGNLPERVKRRVGELVRCSLEEGEGDEYHPVRNGVVLA